MGDDEEVKESQQEPDQDSALQTPQPDQPIPSEPDPTQDAEPTREESASDSPGGE